MSNLQKNQELKNILLAETPWLTEATNEAEQKQRIATLFDLNTMNSGLAVSLAAANFVANPLATLPGAIFSVWHNIAGSIFAGIRRSGVENRTRTGENGVSAA